MKPKTSIRSIVAAWTICCGASLLHARAPAVAILTTPGGVRFALLGERPASPAPTLFVFASDRTAAVESDEFNATGKELARQGWISVAIDMPGHGDDRRPGEAPGLSGWRQRLDQGENIVAPIVKEASEVLDYLVRERYSDPARIAAAGNSRGCFMAMQVAAADRRIGALALFSPMTELPYLKEFKGLENQPLARSLALAPLADKLAGRPIWICIGNRDRRVGTEEAFSLSRQLVAGDERAGAAAPVEFHVMESEGHHTPEPAASLAADWLGKLWPASSEQAGGGAWKERLVLSAGRHQLFLDDFVLGHIYRAQRVIHQPVKAGPAVIAPDGPADGPAIEMRDAPCWDDREKVWKAWYMANGDANNSTAFARSRDGIHWEKPVLGIVNWRGSTRNNLVEIAGHPGAMLEHVFLDPQAPADRRYKGLMGPRDRHPAISADGYHFTLLDVPAIPSEDESHVNWDDLGRQYVLTVKHNGPFGRSVYLSLSRDFERWTNPILIYHADAIDQALGAQHIREIEANPRMWRPTINRPSEYNTEIYNMPVFAYEGMYIGLPTYFESSGLIPKPLGNQDGTNSVKLACSRDLRAWTKVGDRRHFIPISEMGPHAWDTGQILAASHPVRHGDELWFYYSGLDVRYRPPGREYHGSIGLARLRTDGFVSLHAGAEEAIAETRPLALPDGRLWINAEASHGEIRAEITDSEGRSIQPGWGRDDCIPVKGDGLRSELRWRGKDGLGELRGKNVRLRFFIRQADLYSFWPGNS